MNTLWSDIALRAGITLSDAEDGQLSKYLDLLLEANLTMNLTRITDRAAAEVQHVGDSLTVLPLLPPGAHRLVDVGTGGGVPGIPLAIVRPDAHVTLIESTKKKAAFLTNAVGALGLTNVVVIAERAEDVGIESHREAFDVAVARAVATMDWLAEWCLPLVVKRGKFLAMKGAKVVEELPLAARAIKMMGGGDPIVHPVNLPGSEHLVIVEIPKLTRSDKRYPRPATLAKGRPIR